MGDRTQIGRNDNFFLCGGDSLHAARLASLVRSEFEIIIDLTTFFHYQTVASRAALIVELQHKSQQTRKEHFDELLKEIEQMSD